MYFLYWFKLLFLFKFHGKIMFAFLFLLFALFVCYSLVNILQPKTTRNIPIVEQVGFIAGCSEGDHTPMGNDAASQ